jgi:hypothetical protein
MLSSLQPADVEGARLTGELGCTFASDPATILLIAKGDVGSSEGARGAVKIGGYVEAILNQEGGGFDAMSNGATFVGQGKTIRVAVNQAVPLKASEAPSLRATLTYERADGASRRVSGVWTCGP